MNSATRTLGLLTVAAGVLVSTATSVLASPSAPAPTSPDTRIEVREGHRLLHSVQLPDGTTFEFVRSTDGTVGVAEIAPLSAPNRLIDMTGRQGGTTLEVFLAVTPDGTKPPAELVADHEKAVKAVGRNSGAPRDLTLPPNPQAAVDEQYNPGQCDYDTSRTPGHSEFTWLWYWTLGKFKDFTAQQTYFPSHLNGTAGKNWYAGSTIQRWLGACNGNFIFGFPNIQYRAQYQSNGSWHTAYARQIAPEFKLVYSSSFGPTEWRVKLSEISFNVFLNREYAVAVAGNEWAVGGFEAAK